MFKTMGKVDHLRRVRFWLALFMAGLILSGLTAFPLQSEIRLLDAALHAGPLQSIANSIGLLGWIDRVNNGVTQTNARYPFLAYGTDWLAFAHLVIAVAFIGPYVDPVRNKWVVTLWTDSMRGCRSTRSHRWPDSRDSSRLAIDRLQLWRGRKHSIAPLQEAHPCTGAGN